MRIENRSFGWIEGAKNLLTGGDGFYIKGKNKP